ncbi:NAD(P)/FAD-dependent oxidoreductase [Aestuariivirga litoralis]|uniref:NAD(P)/FAD-dependent oxidoreductase n=1 Tax=Aestuariivirga litoralis TaxID=2650924 RepID=UPI0024856D2A|nr:FAD-dependent oxidoreductase [Aestuariivirga litoralis]MBG1232330.1 FAD-dependent oxidoreductase [Aestuariivirga litoralis]
MALTRKRKLKSGTPVWLLSPPRIISHGLSSAASHDIAIIGTGISGALMADALQRVGFSVLVLDRRNIMSGSTPASTALLQSELDVPLTQLEKQLGKSDAARAWIRSAEAVRSLEARVSDLGIDCDWKPRETIYLPGNVLNNDELKLEWAARAAIGMRARYVNRKGLADFSGLSKAGAIITRGNAEADPVKLVQGLWKHFTNEGGTLVNHTEVVDVDQTRLRVRLTTADGKHIMVKHAVFCTGYEVLERARPKGYRIISTWVLATKPQPRKIWKSGSLIWEAADPYLYLRSTADGRIIAGGEDESFSNEEKRDALTPAKVARIAAKAQKLLPEVDFTPEFAWSGCFGESPKGLPAIGPIPGLSRCYAVLGFGGNGITFSMLAAELVSRHIQGLKDPDAELFGL